MMNSNSSLLPAGIWPPALTAFTPAGELDMAGNRALFEHYAAAGVNGLFVTCLTGELSCLSIDEILRLNGLAVEVAAVRFPIVGGVMPAGGGIDAIARDAVRLAGAGVAAVVVLVSQLAGPDEGDDRLLANAERLLQLTGDLPLGLYECPKPYHRRLEEETLGRLAATGRFLFFKDTCCDIARIRRRIELIRGTPLRLYNANAATLLDSFRAGADGYCGVGANYYPELFRQLWRRRGLPEADEIQRFIAANDSLADLGQAYPVSAKYMMQLADVPMSLCCRITERSIAPADCERLRQLDAEAEGLISPFSPAAAAETA